MPTAAQSNACNGIRHDGREYRAFFLRGRMRSGTNWACNLLNLHPKINCHGEFHFEILRDGFQRFAERAAHVALGIGAGVAGEARACYREAVLRCLAAKIDHKPGAEWVGDRTPAPIDDWMPGTPTFCVTRDGRDAVVSWALHRLKLGRPMPSDEFEPWRQAYLVNPDLYEREPHRLVEHEALIRRAAANWRDHVRHDHAMIARAQGGEIDLPVYAFSYEDLHADTERVRREMYEFLGLDASEAEPIAAGSGTEPGDVGQTGLGRGVGVWHEVFTDYAKQWFKQEAGDLLVELGYEKDTNW